ncbi:hypothetical protein [Bacteroides helcogenes]|uniref:Transmembrane protein n=1 Tax=Bacteroides helcogenes (strain ATCC 35417 / DSM 20613 / JCM 6297 / CCUG 15421 / P 36-108) TaxID=693979 RepID=E6SV24_BACT6|nr:hypothetical protein [Bacteroides helcogenes]ADV43406.1 hypothetical protein Bache_1401 [Bacteroides helcogenes P 36-108]MDY5238174.1 hypothetical protein [Bacteroides helcogenes]
MAENNTILRMLKGIGLLLLLIVAGVVLGICSDKMEWSFLRSFAIIAPAACAPHVFSRYFGEEPSERKPITLKHLALGILLVTTLLWVLEKYVF